MGSDDTKRRRSYAAPPHWILLGVFAGGMVAGCIMTLLAADIAVEQEDRAAARAKPMAPNPPQGLTPQGMEIKKRSGVWLESVSELPGPRIYVIHNLITREEAEHMKSLGVLAGMEKALIVPYGGKELVESTTRTNTGAWLDYNQDPVIRKVERTLADVTGTQPSHGENMQILHYETTQQFKEHHDYFDPATDPPDNFEPGGNRLATAIIYLENADEGGETDFLRVGIKVKPDVGDAVLFYNLLPDGTVDQQSIHAGMPPARGEKWVATKWIHEKPYQVPGRKEMKVVKPGTDEFKKAMTNANVNVQKAAAQVQEKGAAAR